MKYVALIRTVKGTIRVEYASWGQCGNKFFSPTIMAAWEADGLIEKQGCNYQLTTKGKSFQ